MTRALCRAEFEKIFLILYPELVRRADSDIVHTVFVVVLETEAYKDMPRGRKRVKDLLLVRMRKAMREAWRKEKREFGGRRVNERD